MTLSSVKVLNALQNNFYTKRMDCNDIDHVSFIIKSDYCLGQLSSNLSFIKRDGLYFAVNNGNLLFCLAFNEKFELFDISNDALKIIENI